MKSSTKLETMFVLCVALILVSLSGTYSVIGIDNLSSDTVPMLDTYSSRASEYNDTGNYTEPEINPEFNLSFGNFSFPEEIVSGLSAVCILTIILIVILIVFVIILTYRNYKEGRYYSSMIRKGDKK